MATATSEESISARRGPIDRSTAIDFHQQVLNLLIENGQLKQQVQQLQHQLDLARQVGGALSPELAKSWLVGLEACDGWKRLKVGDDGWDDAAGQPKGIGLRALIRDLRAQPPTTVDRICWDTAERRRVQEWKSAGIPARPAPDRVQPKQTTSWLLNERQPGLGDSLAALTKGLQGRLPLVIEAAFLLWGDRAVAMLSTDPAGVVKALKAEMDRVAEPTIAANWKTLLDLVTGGQAKTHARQVLGISADANPDEIKSIYRQLAKQHHPDAGGDATRFAEISTAYEVLTTC